MAATKTVDERAQLRNPSILEVLRVPRHGVVTLFGYGITIRVDRGHLMVEDGIGCNRRQARLPRVGHGLRRLVVIGADGMISLAALRWLADQDAAFVMLERDGKVLATTGPVRPSDARLRRAQALAIQSGDAFLIVRELIDRKIAGQEQVARDNLRDPAIADAIQNIRSSVESAQTIHDLHWLESGAANVYWNAWQTISIPFPKNDLFRVPDHWRSFRTRKSAISGSQRVACDPVNAILNYMYALLEAEARLAVAALGLDPGIGFSHLDTPARDSLACDLMEPIRPQVDAFVLDWLARSPLKREWFFEERNGNCRLTAPLATQLAETIPTWRSAVAPIAEWVARVLWRTTKKSSSELASPTRLTQQHKREAKGPMSLPALPAQPKTPRPPNICRRCGVGIGYGQSYCAACAVSYSKEQITEAAKKGRIATVAPEVQQRRGKKARVHLLARWSWSESSQPSWLTKEFYETKIQPLLANFTRGAIVNALDVSLYYAGCVRTGKMQPHPRHWQKLAELVGISGNG